MYMIGFFFFSSRRRHTRWPRDWSSDVCSSDLFETIVRERPGFLDAAAMLGLACYLSGDGLAARDVWEACRARRPEDPRVEAYLAMLSRSEAPPPAPTKVAPRGGKKKKP